jgi:hypothetical protein
MESERPLSNYPVSKLFDYAAHIYCISIVRASPISLFAVEAAGTAIIHTEDAFSSD